MRVAAGLARSASRRSPPAALLLAVGCHSFGWHTRQQLPAVWLACRRVCADGRGRGRVRRGLPRVGEALWRTEWWEEAGELEPTGGPMQHHACVWLRSCVRGRLSVRICVLLFPLQRLVAPSPPLQSPGHCTAPGSQWPGAGSCPLPFSLWRARFAPGAPLASTYLLCHPPPRPFSASSLLPSCVMRVHSPGSAAGGPGAGRARRRQPCARHRLRLVQLGDPAIRHVIMTVPFFQYLLPISRRAVRVLPTAAPRVWTPHPRRPCMRRMAPRLLREPVFGCARRQ